MKILPNTVINFHAVDASKWMEKVFLLLKKAYHIIAINDLEKYIYEGKPLQNSCHITFDDGDQSFYNVAYPLLKKHGIPVSIYVSPQAATERRNFWFQEIRGYDEQKLLEVIGKTYPDSLGETKQANLRVVLKSLPVYALRETIHKYRDETGTPPKPCMNMTPEQLLEVHREGLVAIGVHTQNHPILRNETDESAAHEIKGSIRQLGEMLSEDIRYFAYPNGVPGLDFDIREINLLKAEGIKLAFSTENKAFTRETNPLSMPRKGISKGSRAFIMTKLASGDKWDTIRRWTKGKDESQSRIEKTKAF